MDVWAQGTDPNVQHPRAGSTSGTQFPSEVPSEGWAGWVGPGLGCLPDTHPCVRKEFPFYSPLAPLALFLSLPADPLPRGWERLTSWVCACRAQAPPPDAVSPSRDTTCLPACLPLASTDGSHGVYGCALTLRMLHHVPPTPTPMTGTPQSIVCTLTAHRHTGMYIDPSTRCCCTSAPAEEFTPWGCLHLPIPPAVGVDD